MFVWREHETKNAHPKPLRESVNVSANNFPSRGLIALVRLRDEVNKGGRILVGVHLVDTGSG